MAGTARKWLIGCGIGCGLLVALGLGLGAAGWYGVKHVIRRAESLEAASDSLSARFGAAEAWMPPADGSLDPARVEAFLAARDLMRSARDRASRTFATLDGEGGGGVTAKVAAGVNFVPHILGFIAERDEALLRAGMGPGEYQYLYTVAYFGLLGKDPGDGPGFVVSSRDGNGAEDHGWSFGTKHDSDGSGADREEVRRRRAQDVRESLNRVQRENLRRQLAALDAGGGGQSSWRTALAAEVAALEGESRRFAWEQGLPAPTRAALEPYRDRLEDSYDAMTGTLELSLHESH